MIETVEVSPQLLYEMVLLNYNNHDGYSAIKEVSASVNNPYTFPEVTKFLLRNSSTQNIINQDLFMGYFSERVEFVVKKGAEQSKDVFKG